MYHKTKGIVLRARTGKEADLEVTLYTEEKGRLPARLTSARKGGARLAPLAELFSEAEYHLHMRPGASGATVIGGLPVRSFLGGGFDLDHFRIMARICELVDLLTPAQSPNPLKYQLLSEALDHASRFPHPLLSLSFAVKLLHLAGFGLEPKVSSSFWEKMEECSWEDLPAMDVAPEVLASGDEEIVRHVQDLSQRVLKTRLFEKKMEKCYF